MCTSSRYRFIRAVVPAALAIAVLAALPACETPEETSVVPPPSPPVDTTAVPPSSAVDTVDVPPPPAPAPEEAPAAPVRTVSAVFCALCSDALQRGLITERLDSYRGQCDLCPAVETVMIAGPSAGIDRATGGYTLIVLSSTLRTEAEAAAERFRRLLQAQMLPVDVFESTSEGIARYRVGVGQVATVEQAVALRDRLAGDLPAGTWVIRIR